LIQDLHLYLVEARPVAVQYDFLASYPTDQLRQFGLDSTDDAD
jgi:hypothetical protein